MKKIEGGRKKEARQGEKNNDKKKKKDIESAISYQQRKKSKLNQYNSFSTKKERLTKNISFCALQLRTGHVYHTNILIRKDTEAESMIITLI